MKAFLIIAISIISSVCSAEILTFSSLQLEVDEGWGHSVENGAQVHDETESLISIYHPDGHGILKIRRITAPDNVGRETLRNMTNVDLSTQLTWQAWGDNSGYQHDYSAGASFYRQWWLSHDKSIILVVYESTAELRDIESDPVSKIVNSIKISRL